ncbi:UNVERIFIED_CONTAM: hypothetical protein NCL1_23659 [Trichonephila clavipes]
MDAILKQKKILKVYEIDVNSIDIEINNLNNNLLNTCADKDVNDYEMEMHDLFSKLDTLKIILKEEMKKLVKNDSNTNACPNIVNTNIAMKLQKRRSGDQYSEQCSTLSDSQKLQYLKFSEKGEAATLLQSIQVTNDDYQKAWNALTERCENEAEIINAALNKLVSQPVFLKQESASGLRKLIDTTQQCIDTLKTLKQLVEYWDTLIIFLLRGKLNFETLRVWTLEQTKKISSSEFKSFVLSRATTIASLAECQKEKNICSPRSGGK